MIFKLCKCGEKIEVNKRMCESCIAKHIEDNKEKDRERYRRYASSRDDKEEQALYHNKTWTQLRQAVLNRDRYLCMYSLYIRNEIVVADLVHHIIEVKEDKNKVYQINNLISLSSKVHKKVHEVYNKSEEEREELQGLLLNIVEKINEKND